MGHSTWAHLAEILYKPGSTWMVWGKYNEEDIHSLMRRGSRRVVQFGDISLRFFVNLDQHGLCGENIMKKIYSHYMRRGS